MIKARCFGYAIYHYGMDGKFTSVELVKDYLSFRKNTPNYDLIKSFLKHMAKTGEMFYI